MKVSGFFVGGTRLFEKEKQKVRFQSAYFLSRHLLVDHNGNVNKRNRLNQTSLHCLMEAGNEVRRNECLTLLLKWKYKQTNETVDLDARDSVSDFPLDCVHFD